MIESVFVITLVFALMMNILGWMIGKKSMLGIVFLMIATTTWIGIVAANSLYIEVPGDTTYSLTGFDMFCFMFAFVNICFLVYYLISSEAFKSWKKNSDWRG